MRLRSSHSLGRGLACVLSAALFVHCSSSTVDSTTPPDPGAGADGGAKTDGGSIHGGNHADARASSEAGGDDDGSVPGDDSTGDDGGPSGGCGAWMVGTLTGYNNSNLADDPNAGSVMEFTGLTNAFYDNVNMASIDMSDWPSDKYHYVDIRYNGMVGRVGTWDACADKDCPDGTACCTNNKKEFASPGYLLDIETRTAKRLFNVAKAEDTLNDKIEYRLCEAFDPDAIAAQYGATRQ